MDLRKAGVGRAQGSGHQRMLLGSIVWCNTCGGYSIERGKRLAKPCEGPIRVRGKGGRYLQLLRLRAGKHPFTGEYLGCPVPESSWSSCDTPRSEAIVSCGDRAKQKGVSATAPRVKLGPRVEELRQMLFGQQTKASDRDNGNARAMPSSSVAEQSFSQVHLTQETAEQGISKFERLRQRVAAKELVTGAGK